MHYDPCPEHFSVCVLRTWTFPYMVTMQLYCVHHSHILWLNILTLCLFCQLAQKCPLGYFPLCHPGPRPRSYIIPSCHTYLRFCLVRLWLVFETGSPIVVHASLKLEATHLPLIVIAILIITDRKFQCPVSCLLQPFKNLPICKNIAVVP